MQTSPSKTAHLSSAPELRRSLGLFDSTMIVAGSMIGTGIFIVAAEMSRQVGSAGWLLASWILTGLLTITAALSYGELAAMMPHAGGQYIYLCEAWSPLCGFLYGWTLFLVIQTGTVAAVSIGFARYLGVLWPRIDESNYLIAPIHISSTYAVSLSTAQLVGVLLIALLTWSNSRGIRYGKIVQNLFTRGYTPVAAELSPTTTFGLLVAMCVAQVGSLFAADAWNNITFTAGEVKHPQRNLPLSLALGTLVVIGLYFLVNLAYVVVLPMDEVQHAPSDRVAGAMLQAVLPATGAELMALAIMVSAFGCMNGMLMSGARAYYAMAKNGLFFPQAGTLNRAHVPGWSLIMQGSWTAFLVLIRTYNPATKSYGNLYSNLLDYVVSAALLFYILTIAGVFRLRILRPKVERPYRAFGYPVIPALYLLAAAGILLVLFLRRPSTTFPGMGIVLIGVPVFLAFRRFLASGNSIK